jgi:AcrR family transcriptional regulator
VNHHFGSKAELIERLAHRCQKRFSEWIGPIQGKSGLDSVLRIVGAYVRHFEAPTPEGRAMLVMWGAAFPRSSSVDGMREADRRARAGILHCIAQGKRDGSISSRVDGPAVAVLLLGLLRGVAAQLMTDREGAQGRRARAQCLRFVTQALTD